MSSASIIIKWTRNMELPVLNDLFESVLQQVEEIRKALMPNVDYTTKMLCGRDFWRLLKPYERILAGRCLALMATTDNFPLYFAGKTPGNSNLYRLK